jgi:protein-S-isoprenylcysteine O-methyltransferase Ste14
LKPGFVAYQGSFLLHYLDAIVYPNLPSWIVTSVGVSVCVINLVIYAWRWRSHRSFDSK